MEPRVGPAFEWVGIARPQVGVVAGPIDLPESLPGVILRKQTANGFFGWEIGIAVVKIPIGERQVHDLVERVNVARGVVAH